MTRQPSHDTPARRKATLYCWECDYTSPIDGDWRYDESGDDVAYVCPRCETTIAERPRRSDDANWRRTLRRSLRTWRTKVGIPSRA